MGSHCILRTSQHRARPFSSNPKIYFLLYDTVHNYIGRCSGHIDSSMQLYCQYTATITTANSAHCYFAMAYGSGHSKKIFFLRFANDHFWTEWFLWMLNLRVIWKVSLKIQILTCCAASLLIYLFFWTMEFNSKEFVFVVCISNYVNESTQKLIYIHS